MKKTERWLSLVRYMRVLAISLALLILTGCLAAYAADASVTLDFLCWSSAPATDEVIKLFESRHPGVKVNKILVSWAEYLDKFHAMVAGGTPPDLVLIDGFDYATLASKGLLFDVTNWAQRDGVYAATQKVLHPAFWNEMLVDGRLYSIAPLNAARTMMYYNKDILAAAGIPEINKMQSGWTWDGFLEMAKKLTVTGSDGRPKQWGYHGQKDQFWPWVYMNGGELVSADRTLSPFNQPATYEAIQWLADLMNQHRVWGGTFERGNAAFATNWDSVAVRRYRESSTKIDWDVTTYPAGKKGPLSVIKGNEIAITAGSRHKELAWEFMKFIGSEESYYIYGASGAFFPPHRNAAMRVLNLQADLPPQNLALLVSVNAQHLPVVPGFGELRLMWDKELAKVWSGAASARDAGESIAKLSTSILAAASGTR